MIDEDANPFARIRAGVEMQRAANAPETEAAWRERAMFALVEIVAKVDRLIEMRDVINAIYDRQISIERRMWPRPKDTSSIGDGVSLNGGIPHPVVDSTMFLRGSSEHASGCAVHNQPAYPAGACDCGADNANRHPKGLVPIRTAEEAAAQREALDRLAAKVFNAGFDGEDFRDAKS